MAEVVRMPKLSDTMTEGVVAEWHKKVGDQVESGDLLAEIETDKATMEFESFQDGVLLHVGVKKGSAAPVDAILAILGDKGENIDSLLKEEAAKESVQPVVEQPEVSEETVVKNEVVAPVVEEIKSTPIRSGAFPKARDVMDDSIKVSPLARKLAKERGVNIQFIKGTGQDGRIIKRDIDDYQGGGISFNGKESYRDEPVSQMRKVIAQRLGESKFSAPHFYLTISINMDQAIEARKSINKAIEPAKVSFNDLVIKAAAISLKEHPQVNSSWLGEVIRYNDHVHIGVAVAGAVGSR